MSEYIMKYVSKRMLDEGVFESAEQIVRCRDCRYFHIGTNTDSCGFTDKYANPNGFCSWGKRREQ